MLIFYYNWKFVVLPNEIGCWIKCLINNNLLTCHFIDNCQLNDELLELIKFLIINHQYIHSSFIHYNKFTFKGFENILNITEQNSHLITSNLSNNKLSNNSL